MTETRVGAPGSARGTLACAVLLGLGLNMVLTGVSGFAMRSQMREMAREIEAISFDGDQFAVAGGITLSLGVLVLAAAYLLRRSVHSWPYFGLVAVIAWILFGLPVFHAFWSLAGVVG